jgi:hypothetical protein
MSILPTKERPSVFVSLERLAMPLDEGLQRHGRRPPILAGDEARSMTVQAVGESVRVYN